MKKPNPHIARYLKERDRAREAGDRLATAVRDYLRGQLEEKDIKEALLKYAEDEGWGGAAMSFVIREGVARGQLDVVTANQG